MGRKKGRFAQAMEMVDDDLPDGAYWAMAHEMAGMEYGEGFDELAAKASSSKPHRSAAAWEKALRKALKKVLPEPNLRVYNQGYHMKVNGRFNYYNPRGKWHDSITNTKGQGMSSFLEHVKKVSAILKEHKEQMQ